MGAVSRDFQGAGLFVMADFDNYVRAGLTMLSSRRAARRSSRTASSRTRSTARPFTSRPGSTHEYLRVQRTGDVIVTSYWKGLDWAEAARRPSDSTPLLPVFLSYVLSFVYVGIYWNNHHHMLHACTTVTGAMLWANLHLLFWLSLFPFATGWMGENHFTAVPTALYGVVLLMAAIAYYLLQQAIIRAQGPDSILKKAVGRDWKGKLSPVLYIAAIVATLRFAVDCRGDLRGRSADLADSGPAYRKRSAAQGLAVKLLPSQASQAPRSQCVSPR